MEQQVLEALETIRPYLQNDGGDIELVGVDEADGIVRVRLTGGCAGCPMAQMTLKNGVERIIKEQVPAVTEVIAV